MNVYCKVQECRFKTSHTTKGHKCGKCHNYGHGQLECDYPELKERLREYWNEEMLENDKCNFINCSYRIYHKTSSHLCNICLRFGHNIDNCPRRKKIVRCPICRIDNEIKVEQIKIRGLEEECCICLENKVEVYFKKCGHVCICYDCFIRS